MTRVVIACGLGGVGKTTAAAGVAVAHALAGRRVVVLTIDPARRLADALGLSGLGNEAVEVDLSPIGASGTLHALMLDRKATFDDLVRRHGEPELVERLLLNRYYRAASTRLSGAHEYMAIVKLEDLVQAGRWDVIVLDTPPAQHVVDFFHAPERMATLFEPGSLSALGGGGGLLGMATRRVGVVLERLAGESVIKDVGEFFRLMGSVGEHIRDQSEHIRARLRSEHTGFVLVTAPRLDVLSDVEAFADLLRAQDMRIEGMLVNRVVLPPRLAQRIAAGRLPSVPDDLDAPEWDAVVESLVALPAMVDALARDHAAAISRLSAAVDGAPVSVLPEIPGGVRTLESLARLAPFLPT